MNNITFIKLGGSVITNKSGQEAPDMATIRRLADEIQLARMSQPDTSYLLGHGSGSFGHLYAARYHIHTGLSEHDDWAGFALTSGAALRLNRIVGDALLSVGVPAFSVQSSASLVSEGGTITSWPTENITRALERGLVPVVHGDVAFDTVQGSAIISTEKLFAYLATQTSLQPQRIIIVGEDAVYTADPRIDPSAQPIPHITASNIEQVLSGSSGSTAVDVTGGMRSKIQGMWNLIEMIPGLEIQIIGCDEGQLRRTLAGEATGEGTRMSRS